MDIKLLDAYLEEHSYLGSDSCVTSLDFAWQERIAIVDAKVFPHAARWYSHVSYLRLLCGEPRTLLQGRVPEMLRLAKQPCEARSAAAMVPELKGGCTTLEAKAGCVSMWPGAAAMQFTDVLPFYSHTKRSQQDKVADKALHINRCVFSNLWEDPEGHKFRVPVASEDLGGAALMRHKFLADAAGVCAEVFFQASKCELEADARFLFELSVLDCAKYGQGRLVPNAQQIERMTQLGLELSKGLDCPNSTYSVNSEVVESLRRVPPRRADWERVKLDVMMHVNRHKFGIAGSLGVSTVASESFASLVASRKQWLLVEHPKLGGDGLWGDGGDGSGLNLLGKCLTQLVLEASGKAMVGPAPAIAEFSPSSDSVEYRVGV